MKRIYSKVISSCEQCPNLERVQGESNDLVECSAGGGRTDEILERGYLNVYIDYKRYAKQLDKMFNHCPELKEFK